MLSLTQSILNKAVGYAFALSIALQLFLSLPVVAAEITFRSIVLSSTPAPGTPGGINFRRFNSPVLNDRGQIAVRASIGDEAAPIGLSQDAVYQGDSGTLRLIAMPGTPIDGFTFGSASNPQPALNDLGQTAFRGTLVSGLSTLSAIFYEATGTLATAAREGQAAPGPSAAGHFVRFFEPVLNNAGQSAFIADLPAPGVQNAIIVSEANGTLTNVAQSNQQAPGTPEGVVFLNVNEPVINDQGQTAFSSSLSGTGVDSTNQYAIFAGAPDTLRVVARRGEQIPGLAPGIKFAFAENPVINYAGQVAFYSSISGSDAGDPAGTALFAVTGDTYRVIARSLEQVPDALEGVMYRSFGFEVLINDGGHAAFLAELVGTSVNGSNDNAVFAEGAGGMKMIAREDNQAPGVPDGVRFKELSLPVLNGAGQVAFMSGLSGLSVSRNNDRAMFATDNAGILRLIVRKGDLFDVNDDPLITELRTIASIDMVVGSGGSDGRGTSLNNSGQLAFLLGFTDSSSGIFIANIPEPGSGAVVLLTLTSLFRRQWR